ncbi:MAG: hypothetical protein IKJ19_08030 [Clostridia bacterium]|nr:hypothetical protein [Clostridia bacterium]
MKYSKVIAISALSSALALILLVFGSFIEVFDLSCLFMASLALMLPLAKDYKLGGFLCYLATTILGFLLTGFRLQVMIPFAIFFGLHPLVNYFQFKLKINKFLSLAVKTLWFVGTLYVMYFFTNMFVSVHPIVERFIHYFLTIGGVIFFCVYDYLMVKFQIAMNAIVKRLKL